MEKTAAKKWKCLYLLSALLFLFALILLGSWLVSEPGQVTSFKKALGVGALILAFVGTVVAKIGSWFFHGDD